MQRRRLLLIPLFLLLPAAALAWLLLTESGLHGAASLLSKLSGGKLQLEQVSGRLAERVHIGTLRWQDVDSRMQVRDFDLRWSPLALLRGTLQIDALGLGDTAIETGNSEEAARLPDSLALPFRLNITRLAVAALRINGQLIADSASASLHATGAGYVLERLTLQRDALGLQAHGTLAAQPPFALSLDASLDGKLQDKPFALVLKAGGDLSRSEVALQRRAGPFDLDLQTVLRPYAKQPLAALAFSTKDLDLAALLPTLPRTRISANCRLAEAQGRAASASPSSPAPSTNCRLDNALAGPIDKQRLPLRQMRVRLSLQEQQLQLSALRLSHGSSVLQGQAHLGSAGLNAELEAQAVDLSGIHSRARPTRLSGPITINTTPGGQTLRADLRDATLALQMQLARSSARIQLERLALKAHGASVLLQGHLDSTTQNFLAEGRFDQFNPAQFLRAAKGQLNGDFSAAGRLGESPQLRFEFALRNSRLADAPATGGGQLELAGPQVRKANLALDLGPNRARLTGAFGRPGEKLLLEIEAPKLAPYGIEGDLQARLEASGRLEALQLQGNAHSTLLRLPGQGRISQLKMASDIGARPNDPMQLQLQFEQLDLAAGEHSLRKFMLDVHGSRRQHEIRLSALLDADMPLQLAARGGFAAKAESEWQGSLTQLSLAQPAAQRELRLAEETPLLLGATRWTIGPARLVSSNASLRLQGSAVAGRMQVSAQAGNPGLGRASIELSARPQNVWRLSAQTPLQGRLQASVEDLAWFNALLGPMWRASGRLDADVQLAGTLQLPLLNGDIRGDALGLRQIDTRMHLHQGRLRAHLRNSLLTLEEFSAQSELTAPPPALQRLLDDKGRALIATPGRISAQGRMQVGAQPSAEAEALALEFKLERLGVAQTPQQWLLLSGQGRLNWQQARLGMQASLGVDAAHWQLADLSRPQLSDDVVVHRAGKSDGEARRLTPWRGEVQIGLGRHFSFAGAGARGRLAGQIQVSANAQDLPRASGTVTLVDGRYEAYGQQLEIERGILNFQGLLENPALNIVALRKGLPVEAGVAITGYAQAPVVRLVSEPNVPDAEKLSWLVLGRPPEHDGNDSGVLMAAVGAIFGGQSSTATQQLKDSFGIDEISVRSGVPGQGQAMRSSVVAMGGSSASSGQVLAVGKQLSNRLRLSYEQALGGATSLVKLTLKLSERVSVVGTSGTDAALDVFYSFSFGGNTARRR